MEENKGHYCRVQKQVYNLDDLELSEKVQYIDYMWFHHTIWTFFFFFQIINRMESLIWIWI
jgi:hypothetical protein